jgi:hypothetical protein
MLLCYILVQVKGGLELDRAPEGSARYWMLLCYILVQVKGVLDLDALPLTRDQSATGCCYAVFWFR